MSTTRFTQLDHVNLVRHRERLKDSTLMDLSGKMK